MLIKLDNIIVTKHVQKCSTLEAAATQQSGNTGSISTTSVSDSTFTLKMV